jgi:hypothetical protein
MARLCLKEDENMPETMSEEEIYKLARKRVQDKKDFFTHLLVYIVINAMLVAIWAFTTSPGYRWFIWPMLGWGIGVILHGLSVFVFDRQGSWERSAVEKEAARLRGGK